MATMDQMLEVIDEKILELIPLGGEYVNVRNLAEARAWILHPGQNHGGGTDAS
jgi:hypothetical protein